MKNMALLLIVFILSLSGVKDASAAKTMLGGKTGFMLIEGSGIDDVIPLGIVYSRSLDTVAPNVWFEGEFNYGLLGGDFSGGELDIWTMAAYAAYHHPLDNSLYLKGKIGLLYERVEVSTDCCGSASDSDTGLSLGFGGGFKINDRMTGEVEYTIIEADVDFLSFAVKVPFN